MKVTPESTAAWRASSASVAVTSPQSAPSCQVPMPMAEMLRPSACSSGASMVCSFVVAPVRSVLSQSDGGRAGHQPTGS
jgi:hypothetical protein